MTPFYTYIETLDPDTMVRFLEEVVTAYPENYWIDENYIEFYSFGNKIGSILLSQQAIVGKIKGIKLFQLLQPVPGFYDMLRGTTYVKDLDNYKRYEVSEEEE